MYWLARSFILLSILTFDYSEPGVVSGDMYISLDTVLSNSEKFRTHAYLYLSGTPFRAISTGEFIEEQIYNWTYSDEQRSKESWQGPGNPYAQLPKMVMLTYQLPDSIREIASQGEFDEFDLNEFFRADDKGFIHEEYVQKWLDMIRGAYTENIVTELKLGTEKPPMPFSDARLLSYLQHTYWFLICSKDYWLHKKRKDYDWKRIH